MNFHSFNLDPTFLSNIQSLGYKNPTSIQSQSIPHILAGLDVMGLAQTGTGKTAAFALPILQRLIKGPRSVARALIIAPTRELAEQIHNAVKEFSNGTGLRSVTLYGGVKMGNQIKNLKRGADIIIACPGRLLDHIERRTVHLSKVEVLVLDEADQMFDMGFLPSIRRMLRHIPKDRQTLLFSATMPDAINQLAREVLHKPITVAVNHSKPVTSIDHVVFPVAEHLKEALLTHLLYTLQKETVLVFTRTKHRAKKIAQNLNALGFQAASLQGNLTQNQRRLALDGFRNGSHQILVATDIASRGIDIVHISHVINFDIPDTVESYTHRIGRTGRADRTGKAFTFATSNDSSQVRQIERSLGTKLEQRKLEDFDYKAAKTSQGHSNDRPKRKNSQENEDNKSRNRSKKNKSNNKSNNSRNKIKYKNSDKNTARYKSKNKSKKKTRAKQSF